MQGTTKQFKVEASFLSWFSCFGTVILLRLFMLVVQWSVLFGLRLCSGYCMCILE